MRKLRLNDRRHARETLARFIREFDSIDPTAQETQKFRALVHAMAILLENLGKERNDDALDRIQQLEERLRTGPERIVS